MINNYEKCDKDFTDSDCKYCNNYNLQFESSLSGWNKYKKNIYKEISSKIATGIAIILYYLHIPPAVKVVPEWETFRGYGKFTNDKFTFTIPYNLFPHISINFFIKLVLVAMVRVSTYDMKTMNQK